MRWTVTAAAAALLFAGSAGARALSGGLGTFGPAVAFVDFDGLNDAFAPRGFDKLSSMQWMFGGSGHAYFDRVVLGGTGWGGTQAITSDSLHVRAEVSLAGGAFDVGYSVISIPHLVVSPVLGIGGGGYDITLEPTRSDVDSFGGLLDNPGRTSRVSFSGFTLTPELMVNIPISFVGIQVRGGYMFTPQSPTWELEDGGKLLHGPAVARGAPYVSLNVAFGGLARGSTHRHRPMKY